MAILVCNCTKKEEVHTSMINPSPFGWGTSLIGDTVKIQVSYTNLTDDIVIIDYIDTPCGCITAIPRKFVVERGDSSIIDINYTPTDLGYTEKNLFLYLKKKEFPVHFMIKGKVVKR
ncbi:DUF1573 domain-containing protein [Dysgonomonas reticulitermitis]